MKNGMWIQNYYFRLRFSLLADIVRLINSHIIIIIIIIAKFFTSNKQLYHE